jgi:cyclohexyl-isocyanide hydratase
MTSSLTRRTFSAAAAAAVAGSIAGPAVAAAGIDIAMLVHPDMVALDLIGPQTVLGLLPGARIHLVGRTRDAVVTEIGLPIRPTTDFAGCPAAPDILFVPGGLKGSVAAMQDRATLDFLADRGARAGFVTSVCTGALVLGAAGLLRGYNATTHWYVRDLLPLFGAVAAEGRVVADRNRMTAGGVTAGVDFGLTLAARLQGEDVARRLQLILEYDPAPPFQAGNPAGAGPVLTAEVLGRRKAALDEARVAAAAAARSLP